MNVTLTQEERKPRHAGANIKQPLENNRGLLMHILYTTFNEDIFVKTFATEREAAEYALEMLGSDYADRFWIDDDGHLRQDDGMRDFNVDIYSSIQELIYKNICLPPDVLGTILRKLGEDLEENGERMEEYEQ